MGWAVWTAAVAEVVAIVVGALLLLRDNPRPQPVSSSTPAVRRAHLD